ncbi:MAG: lamin tail domain-containing protein [Phycisphaerae bacterium]|nr:lamin tail domain-containing protein [Phycisphaerae bacterium]
MQPITRALIVCLGLLWCVGGGVYAANPGDVVITEIMYNPNSSESVASNAPLTEWIEVYNRTDQDIDMAGWYTADEDGRSGDFPAFTLPAGGVAVIIPMGYSSNILTKAMFTAAWGVPESQLIQPTSANDMSRGRSSTSVRGGIVGDGFSNSPTRDDDDANDLVNTPFDPTAPCAYGQAFCDTGIPDNEVLLLVSSDHQVIDKVNLEDDTRGWPCDDPDGPSIVLDEARLNVTDNDDGQNWRRAVVGEARARNNAPAGFFTGLDTGSPGKIEGVTPPGNDAPLVADQTLWAAKNMAVDVTLSAFDDQPMPAVFNFAIDTLPSYGTLSDPGNSDHVIVAGELPYTLAGQGSVVRYTNAGTCADDSFTFHANDAELDSNIGTVTLTMQCGEVIITEIMYDPASTETSAKVNEWIEIHNTTDSAIDVSGWYLQDRNKRAGDWPAGTIIPPGGVAVVVPPGKSSRILDVAQFVTAWDGYVIPQIIQSTTVNDASSGEITGSGLSNSISDPGEDVRLIDASGRVQDRASYIAGWPWPAEDDLSSIFLVEGSYNALDNDDGMKWRHSVNCAGGGYGCFVSSWWDKVDFGSPGFLSGVTAPSGNIPPSAVSKRVGVFKNTSTLVDMPGCDDGQPSGTLTYTIVSLDVTRGVLKDAANGQEITAANLPYTLLGSQVEYIPNDGHTSVYTTAANEDSFSYQVSDGAKSSRQDGTVTLVVQKGGLVLSEIMYNPANRARNDWQYYEIYNTTENDIELQSITVASEGTMWFNYTIPAGAVRVVTSGESNASRTPQDFLDEWAPLAIESVMFVDATLWGKASNSGSRIQLVDSENELLDEVFFASEAPWPVYDVRSSIAARSGKIHAIENDDGASWLLSAVGVEEAYATPDAPGGLADSDVGSPGVAPAPCVGDDCVGACCLPEDQCEMTTWEDCRGAWQGYGTVCGAVDCPAVCPMPFGDKDLDGDVDAVDFGFWQACFTGVDGDGYDEARCHCYDRDLDDDVDTADFAEFEACFTGPAILFDRLNPPLGCNP